MTWLTYQAESLEFKPLIAQFFLYIFWMPVPKEDTDGQPDKPFYCPSISIVYHHKYCDRLFKKSSSVRSKDFNL